jgi:hypothetical protein
LNQNERDAHPATVHTCECDRSFSTKEALQKHERISGHTTLEPQHYYDHDHDHDHDRDSPDRDSPDRDSPDRDSPDRDSPDRDSPDRDSSGHDSSECQPTFEEVVSLFEREFPAHQAAFDCGFCPRTFYTEEALQQHERESPAHRDTFGRERFDRLFSPEHVLLKHELELLAHGATIDCKCCHRSFSTTEALHQHECGSIAQEATLEQEISHAPTSSGDDRSFSTEDALQQRERDSSAHEAISEQETSLTSGSSNSPSSEFECEQCDRSFFTESALRQHECDSPAHASGKPWSLQLALHDDVLHLLSPVLSVEFFEASGFDDCIKLYDTHIMGSFTCTNDACRTGRWSSKMVALTIRLYRGKRYNAVVWHQRCRRCETFGQLMLDDTYAMRVAYRLRRWFRKPVKHVTYSAGKAPAHESELGEGCQNGHSNEERFLELGGI